MTVDLIRSLMSGQERFAVTGASGWFGRTTLDILSKALGPKRFRQHVSGFASVARTVTLRDATVVNLQPLDQLTELAPPPTHLLHYAYLTRDRVTQVGIPSYVQTNAAITAKVVGAIERFRPLGVFTTSSGAVYESGGTLVTDVAGNPYGALKHLEELAVRRAAADVAARSVVARVFSVSGAYMTKPQLYALGDFVLQTLAGGPIRIRAGGVVERSYCAAADVIAVALCCLIRGEDDDVIFDSGGEVVELGALAGAVREALGRPDIQIERSWQAESPIDRYVGHSGQMSTLAANHHLMIQSLEDQVRETGSYLAESLRSDEIQSRRR